MPDPTVISSKPCWPSNRSTAGGNPGSWRVRVDNTDPEKLNTLLLTNPAGASYADCGWGEENSWTPMGWYCNVIAVDPVDPDVVWAPGVDLFRSEDGGRSWGLASYWWARDFGPSFVHADQHAIVFHPDYDGVSNTSMFSATEWLALGTDDDGEPWLFAFTHGRGAWKVRINPLPPAPLTPTGRRRP